MEQPPQNDWLKKLKGIFIEENPTASAPTDNAPAKASPPNFAAYNAPATTADAGLIDDLAGRFQKLVEEKNQPGFDFFEFSSMVLGVSQTPTADHFKIAFQGAKVMNTGVSKEQLLQSAVFYKQTLETAYADTIKKGEEKRRAIGQQQVAQQQNLTKEINGIDQQVADFQKKITDLQALKAAKTNELSALAGSFEPQIAEVEAKLNATTLAKDQVLGRLSMIEEGIKQYV
jgi:hypothetical protein